MSSDKFPIPVSRKPPLLLFTLRPIYTQSPRARAGIPADRRFPVAVSVTQTQPAAVLRGVELDIHYRVRMTISVIIPAYNESAYILETLGSLNEARDCVEATGEASVEMIVVDNGSSDRTADLAASHGARVIFEPVRSVARARNAGARAASGKVLVFVDADTIVPSTLLSRIAHEISGNSSVGGAARARCTPRRPVIRWYLTCWRLLAKTTGMAQGATLFCTAEAYYAIRGYDERLYMGEDVDFYWRLGRYARRTGRRLCVLNDLQVITSSRRFDLCALWEVLIWTNPVFIALFRKRKSAWRRWYESPPR
jgi:glycosyltransferase involved in cell wall biosynthesis